MLLIEDFDIGVRALHKDGRMSAMAELAAWLDTLCAQGWADRWGLMLLSGLANEVADWVGSMAGHARAHRRFACVALRTRYLGKALCAGLARDGLELIELTERGDMNPPSAMPYQSSGLLMLWQPADDRVTETTQGFPDGS